MDGFRAGTRSVRVLRAWRDGRPASHDSLTLIDNTLRCGQMNFLELRHGEVRLSPSPMGQEAPKGVRALVFV